jgi:transposase
LTLRDLAVCSHPVSRASVGTLGVVTCRSLVGLARIRPVLGRCPPWRSGSTEVRLKPLSFIPKSVCPPRGAGDARLLGGRSIRVKVLIGVDPHKATNAVAVIDEHGEPLERTEFSTNRRGLQALERWAKRFPERRWAVEGANGLGRTLSQRLVCANEEVVDVPAKLSARVRVLSTGHGRKNDELDATFTALAAWRIGRLTRVRTEVEADVLRLLSERREDLVSERTRILNRLHGLLRDLVPGGVPGMLSADRATRVLRGIRPRRHPSSASDVLRRRMASELVRDVRALDRKIAGLGAEIREGVERSGTSLTEIFGVGPILAAKIIGLTGDVGRFPGKGHFASYAGVAPIEVSSGEVMRHRLSLAGNRRLNHALHMVAINQVRYKGEGGVYYRKKIAEGKTHREAMRCLKRRVSDAVFKRLRTDSERKMPMAV